MDKNKTKETSKSVDGFIKAVESADKQKDSHQIIKIMKGITGCEPKMWGPSIIGFGSCHYKYESGREGDMPVAAFSPRKPAIVFYLSGSFENREELLKKLGKHKTTKGCVYVSKLDDINIEILKKMIVASIKHVQALYPVANKK